MTFKQATTTQILILSVIQRLCRVTGYSTGHDPIEVNHFDIDLKNTSTSFMSSLVLCKLEKRPQVARCHLSTPEMRAYLSDAKKKQVPYCDSAFLTQTKIKAEQGREHLPKKEESLTFFSCTVTTQLRQGFSECSHFL